MIHSGIENSADSLSLSLVSEKGGSPSRASCRNRALANPAILFAGHFLDRDHCIIDRRVRWHAIEK
jgi:hypothetical protein